MSEKNFRKNSRKCCWCDERVVQKNV